MKKRLAKRLEYLTFSSSVKSYALANISDAFADMLQELGAVPDAQIWADQIGRNSGSHLLKLIYPRAKQNVLRYARPGSNHAPRFVPSPNALATKIAKIAYRPLAIDGHEPVRTLVDHIVEPDEISAYVCAGFAKVFGQDALTALETSLAEPLDDVDTLPQENFPIVFIPSPIGGDLQITPISPAFAYLAMRGVANSFLRKKSNGADAASVRRGKWHFQRITKHLQNISGMLPGDRVRFLATMPESMSQLQAETFRYVKGGRFPELRDPDIADELTAYADLLERQTQYSNKQIRDGLNWRADRLIRQAVTFRDEIVAQAKSENPSFNPVPTNIPSILLSRRWPSADIRTHVQRALDSDHFHRRLAVAGGAS